MYGREVAVEVAVNLLGAVVLDLNTRGHCGAVWRSGSDLRGQQGGGFGRSVVGSEARWLQGRHGRQEAGGGSGGGGGTAAGVAGAGAGDAGDAGGVRERVRRTLRVGVQGSVLPQREEGRQGGGRGRLSASQAGGEDGRTLGVLVEARLAVDAGPRVRLVGWEPTWRGE